MEITYGKEFNNLSEEIKIDLVKLLEQETLTSEDLLNAGWKKYAKGDEGCLFDKNNLIIKIPAHFLYSVKQEGTILCEVSSKYPELVPSFYAYNMNMLIMEKIKYEMDMESWLALNNIDNDIPKRRWLIKELFNLFVGCFNLKIEPNDLNHTNILVSNNRLRFIDLHGWAKFREETHQNFIDVWEIFNTYLYDYYDIDLTDEEEIWLLMTKLKEYKLRAFELSNLYRFLPVMSRGKSTSDFLKSQYNFVGVDYGTWDLLLNELNYLFKRNNLTMKDFEATCYDFESKYQNMYNWRVARAILIVGINYPDFLISLKREQMIPFLNEKDGVWYITKEDISAKDFYSRILAKLFMDSKSKEMSEEKIKNALVGVESIFSKYKNELQKDLGCLDMKLYKAWHLFVDSLSVETTNHKNMN